MKDTIRSILKLLDKGIFRNEQHVRFSLAARICEKLKWDIWNPYVFDTEDPADKFVTNNDGKSTKGKIDIALYKTTTTSRTAHIFIEVKMVGVLSKNIQTWRSQLEQYSLKINPPLSVLTDGIRWEFFLNCLNTKKGKYAERLINSFELSEDDIDAKCMIIENLMRADVSKTSLESLGRKMRKEYEIIQYIQDVKQQAIGLHPGDLLKQTYAAQEMIKHTHNVNINHKRLSELWDRNLALGGLIPKTSGDGVKRQFGSGVITDPLPNYTGKSIVEISIRNQEVISLGGLKDLKKAVYDFVLKQIPKYTPQNTSATVGIHEASSNLRRPVQLSDGRFIECSLSANETVRQCRKALEEAGFSPNDLVIGYK